MSTSLTDLIRLLSSTLHYLFDSLKIKLLYCPYSEGHLTKFTINVILKPSC